jgi:2-haloacid dehalogenase
MSGQFNPFATVKACVFDAYGTLFDVHSAVRAYQQRVGAHADAFSATWRQKQLEYTWLRSLMGVHVDFWQVTGDALDYALAKYPAVDPALRAPLMQAYLHVSPYPEVPGTLRQLKALGLRVAILSNGSPRMLHAAVENAGLREVFDQVLSVESVQTFKPDKRVYHLACDQLELRAHEICFLSSNAWDAAGAAHCGMTVVWLNRFGQPPERLPGTPAAVIDTLDQLLAFFEPFS